MADRLSIAATLAIGKQDKTPFAEFESVQGDSTVQDLSDVIGSLKDSAGKLMAAKQAEKAAPAEPAPAEPATKFTVTLGINTSKVSADQTSPIWQLTCKLWNMDYADVCAMENTLMDAGVSFAMKKVAQAQV